VSTSCAPRFRHLGGLVDLHALPAVARRATARALRVWGDLPTIPTCSHLTESQPPMGISMCVHHPLAGVKCPRCAELHRHRRHPDRTVLDPLVRSLAIDTGARVLHPVTLVV